MRNSIFVASLLVAAVMAAVPARALPHVDYVRSEIHSRYNVGVEGFCLLGYAKHNWLPALPRQGV